MKRLLKILFAVCVLLSCTTHPILASNINNARWQNVTFIFNDLQNVDGELECFISIESPQGASTENVTISLDKITTSGTVNITSWENLSGNYRFTFLEYVPVAELKGTYRLTVSADVILDGVVEHIEDSTEKYYA